MKDLFMSGASGGFHQAFRQDSFNPLLYQSHAHSFAYGDHDNLQADSRPASSTFLGDFKPMMLPNTYSGRTAVIPENRAYPNKLGRSMMANMQFGL